MGEEQEVYKVLVENPEGTRPLGRPWDQNGSWGEWLGECTVNPFGSG
jgi:hypothetical protein